MAVVKVYDQDKVEQGEVTLSADVFEVAVRPEILHLVARAQQAAKRAGTHAAKTRAYVSGGGVKPWRQKGTGRARSGSNRSPVWRGGAVVFGPQPRTYEFKVNKKIRKLALRMALTAKLAGDALMVVKNIEIAEPKTKLFAGVADKLGLEKALIIAPEATRNVALASRNLPGVSLTTPDQLSVYEILKHKQVVLLEGAVEPVETRLK
ncbi:MAG: 50S ribosomal protein L4 [Desulfovibrionaceae bacterium]|nr:50S ribosomal protein L4 [Desulfovibrionaceae bacterium]MBR5734835.1 50S ribosomal protein L4 [Desulfovibrionaceae bacterium]